MKLLLLDNLYNALIIELRLQGIIHRALVDTGATYTIVDASILPPNAHKRQCGHSISMTGNGLVKKHRLSMRFNLGEKYIMEIRVGQQIVTSHPECPFSIIIGQDLLRQFRHITIDYVEKTIEFAD